MFTHVEVLKDDTRLGIKAGEVYEFTTYQYDSDKVILLSRVPDGYEPMCTQYKGEVRFLSNSEVTNV